MEYRIGLLRGDGIGPEIVDSAVRVLEKIGEKYGHRFVFTPYLIGGAALDATGEPLPPETVAGCLASDSVLLGAVGGPKWDDLPGDRRPEKALLGIRSAMQLYTNLRPARLYPALRGECPLRPDIVQDGFDLLIVRELTGGIYFGDRGYRTGKYGEEAYDTECYSRTEIARIAHAAFRAAERRRGRVTSIDKANVLETSRLWRRTVHEIAGEYPEVTCTDMLVDNDEPIHGSAPDIAGQNLANPIATVLSAAMMLRYSFSLTAEADAIEAAVDAVLSAGWRTADLLHGRPGALGTVEMTDRILAAL